MGKNKILFDLQISSFDAEGRIKISSDSNYVFFLTLAKYIGHDYACAVLAPGGCVASIQEDLDDQAQVFGVAYGSDYYTARFQFDMEKVLLVIDKFNPDIVWTNNPIWVPFYKAALRKRGKDIPVFSYNHWIDLPKVRKESAEYTLEHLQVAGTLASDAVLANSNWGLTIIKEGIKESIGKNLEKAMIAFPPPLQELPVIRDREVEKRCVYNHRISSHPYYSEALKIFAGLMDGTDMLVVFTNPSGKEVLQDFSFPTSFVNWDKDEYLQALAKSYCSVSTLIDAGAQWSMSIVESVASLVPTLIPRHYGYKELFPADYPLYYGSLEEAKQQLVSLLEERPSMAKYAEYAKDTYGREGTLTRFTKLVEEYL